MSSKQPTTSDKRIGYERTPLSIAKEAALQKSRIGVPRAGGKGKAPIKIYRELLEELTDLCGSEWAEELIAEAAKEAA